MANDPGAHGAQSDGKMDPSNGMNVPGAHFQHSGIPVRFPYVPAGHGKHSAFPGNALWNPMAQSTHAANDLAPASGLKVPGGHDRHSAIASLSPYCPGGQRMHCPAPAPDRVPVAHMRH